MRGSYPEKSQPEPAPQFEAEVIYRSWSLSKLGSAARQAHPCRVAVRVVKAAGAELGLFFTERGGHLEVTRYTGALATYEMEGRQRADALGAHQFVGIGAAVAHHLRGASTEKARRHQPSSDREDTT